MSRGKTHYRLIVDHQEYEVTPKQRPSIKIQEMCISDKKWVPGKQTWLPMELEELNIHWRGKKSVELALYEDHTKIESWILQEATILNSVIEFGSVIFNSIKSGINQ